MRAPATFGLVVWLFLTSACTGSGPDSRVEAMHVSDLNGRQFWAATAYEGGELLASVVEPPMTLAFTEFGAESSGGCGSRSGPFSLDESRLTVDLVASLMTDVGCRSDLAVRDSFVWSVVGGEPFVLLDGDALLLATDNASIEFIDVRAVDLAQIEDHVWEVSGFARGRASSGPGQYPVLATFSFSDGLLSGYDSCSHFTVSYSFTPHEGDGARIDFDTVETVVEQDDCSRPGVSRLDL